MGQNSVFAPSFTLKNPLCGGSKILNTLHLVFAVLIGLVTAGIGFYTVKWIDGEAQVRGSFAPFKNRRISRFKKGSVAKAVVAAVFVFVFGVMFGLLVPLWVEVVGFVLLLLVAWMVGRFR